MSIANKPRIPIAFIVVIGTLDLVFTLIALQGGWLVEQNPIADHVLSTWGGWGLVAFKTASAFIACTTIWVAIKLGWPKKRRLLAFAVVSVIIVQSLLLMHWARCLSQFL